MKGLTIGGYSAAFQFGSKLIHIFPEVTRNDLDTRPLAPEFRLFGINVFHHRPGREILRAVAFYASQENAEVPIAKTVAQEQQVAVAESQQKAFGQLRERFVRQVIDVMIFGYDDGVAGGAMDLQHYRAVLEKRIIVLVRAVNRFGFRVRALVKEPAARRSAR